MFIRSFALPRHGPATEAQIQRGKEIFNLDLSGLSAKEAAQRLVEAQREKNKSLVEAKGLAPGVRISYWARPTKCRPKPKTMTGVVAKVNVRDWSLVLDMDEPIADGTRQRTLNEIYPENVEVVNEK